MGNLGKIVIRKDSVFTISLVFYPTSASGRASRADHRVPVMGHEAVGQQVDRVVPQALGEYSLEGVIVGCVLPVSRPCWTTAKTLATPILRRGGATHHIINCMNHGGLHPPYDCAAELAMSEIPIAHWTWINLAADRFERAWKDGLRPLIEDFLNETDKPRRQPLLEELLRVTSSSAAAPARSPRPRSIAAGSRSLPRLSTLSSPNYHEPLWSQIDLVSSPHRAGASSRRDNERTGISTDYHPAGTPGAIGGESTGRERELNGRAAAIRGEMD
jgi:hypothetical protein